MSAAPPVRARTGLTAAFGLVAKTALAGAVLLLGYVLHAHALINHDVAWLMIAAQRMLAGGSYSGDFFEVNMPLAIAVYIPPVVLVRTFGLPFQQASTIYLAALSLQAIWLGAVCLRSGAEPLLGRRAVPLFAACLLLGLLFLPGYDFAQKEHLIVVLGLPFVCLVTNDQAAAGLGRALRIYITVLAALGFYLKPHFAALPFLLLAVAAWRCRSSRLLRSPEMGTLLFAGLANALVVILMFRDWFTVARWAGDLYGAFESLRWSKLLEVTGLPVVALCLAVQCAVCAGSRRQRRILLPLLLCSLYATAVYVLQFKGWSYQFLAVSLFVFAGQGLLLCCGLAPAAPAQGARSVPRILGGAIAAAALLLAGLALLAVYRQRNVVIPPQLKDAFAVAAKGDYVYVFSFEVKPAFPTVQAMGLNWASRYSHLWPLLGLIAAHKALPPAQQQRLYAAYAGPLGQAVLQDFERYRPRVVLVDRRIAEGAPPDFDILAPFLALPDFAAIWRRYSKIGWLEFPAGRYGFDIYLREADAAVAASAPLIHPLPPVAASNSPRAP